MVAGGLGRWAGAFSLRTNVQPSWATDIASQTAGAVVSSSPYPLRDKHATVKATVKSLVVKWLAFNLAGNTYDLSHLHTRTFKYERPAENANPAEVYSVDTLFTSHCFTRKPKPDEVYDSSLVYPHDDEKRLFDIRRYELSKRLPEIIQSLPEAKRKPIHTGRGKYFTVEIVTADGTTIDYELFFKVRKVSKGRLEMIVETAFVRDIEHNSVRPAGRAVRFWIILHNTLNNKKIST